MALYLDRLKSPLHSVGYSSGGSSGSRTATSLSDAFVNATSGPAVAIRYMAQTADPIDELYVFLDNVGGTLANVTMAAEIFNESSNSARPGTTSRDTSTATTMPAAVDKWIKFTFGTPYTPTVGEILWIVIRNTSASPTVDYPQILTATNTAFASSNANDVTLYTTTNGFTTNGSAVPEMPFVIKQGSNYFGQPFTQYNASAYTSNQLERGFQFTCDEDVVVSFASGSWSNGNVAAFRILADATAPGGAAAHEFDLDSDANETTGDLCGAKVFDTPVTLTGGTSYKATLTFSGNLTSPGAIEIEDYSSYSSVFDALRACNTMSCPWSVIDNGAGGWTVNKALVPLMFMGVRSYPEIAGGGGGGLLTHPGMSGGMRG